MGVYDNRVGEYISGLADKELVEGFENELLLDDGLLERFIASCEKVTHIAPPGLKNMVMDSIAALAPPVKPKVPLLGKKLCAAVCFCSAAVIAMLAITGYEITLVDFMSNQSGRLFSFLNTLISN